MRQFSPLSRRWQGVRCQWGQFGVRASPYVPPSIDHEVVVVDKVCKLEKVKDSNQLIRGRILHFQENATPIIVENDNIETLNCYSTSVVSHSQSYNQTFVLCSTLVLICIMIIIPRFSSFMLGCSHCVPGTMQFKYCNFSISIQFSCVF